MRYYIDPATLLPAYSVSMTTPPLTIKGAPRSDPSFKSEYTLFEYSFPDQLDPAAMQATGTPTVPFRVWPFGRAELG